MRALLQRVKRANVTVDGKTTGSINDGLLIFLGVGKDDSEADCEKLCEKALGLRIFSDENDKINLSVRDINGEVLVVSQFTLYADNRKGNRPNFINAAPPDTAQMLYDRFCALCREKLGKVQCGIFGADMSVELINDGPFTILLESR